MSQTNTSDALAYVAHTFAEAYYGLLVDPENFANLHTFYKLDAVFTRGDEAKGQSDASTTSGLEAIKKELAAFHNEVRNCEVNLKVMDSQYSVNQGIVITAVGSFDRLESGAVKSRRFVQTFFLEAQTPNNYSIRNEIVRYLNDSAPKKVAVAKEEPKPQSVPAATTTTAANGTEAHSTPVAPVTPAVETNGDAAKKQPQEKKKSTATSPTTGRKGRQNRKGEDKPRREAKSEEQPQTKPAKPATWANVVSGNAVTAGTPPPAAEQTKPKAASKQQAQAAQQQQQGQQQAQQPKLVKDKKPKQERETGLSLYVGNLPFEATPQQVFDLFTKYGAIKEVVLKRGYGFVEFNSAEELKKVLDTFTANPVELDGRLLTIEDRKRGERSGGAKPNGRSQVKPTASAAKRGGKTGGRANDNAAH